MLSIILLFSGFFFSVLVQPYNTVLGIFVNKFKANLKKYFLFSSFKTISCLALFGLLALPFESGSYSPAWP